jgi:hypothetical protein
MSGVGIRKDHDIDREPVWIHVEAIDRDGDRIVSVEDDIDGEGRRQRAFRWSIPGRRSPGASRLRLVGGQWLEEGHIPEAISHVRLAT